MIYLDSSALVKLVIVEAETAALRSWLKGHPMDESPRVTSDISAVEVPRAVMRAVPTALLQAQLLMARTQPVVLTEQVLNQAAALQPSTLCSLDAVHLASALALEAKLSTFVAYDHRLSDAAESMGLSVCSPGAG